MTFSGDLARFSDETLRKMEVATQKIALDTFTTVIFNTPVDTGRLRGSWNAAIGQPLPRSLTANDPDGGDTLARVGGVVENFSLGEVIYMATNVEYAPFIENGTDKIAPRGMVALAVQRYQPVAAQVIAELANGG